MANSENRDDVFRLTISGKGVDVDRSIDGQTLAKIMAFLLGADASVPARPGSSSAPLSSTGGAPVPPSLREFLDGVEAKRKSDQIVAIGHYITQFEGQAHFSREEVKVRFSNAREPMPANFPRDFAAAERTGRLAKVHGREGKYYVTKTGLVAIENKFSKGKVK